MKWPCCGCNKPTDRWYGGAPCCRVCLPPLKPKGPCETTRLKDLVKESIGLLTEDGETRCLHCATWGEYDGVGCRACDFLESARKELG